MRRRSSIKRFGVNRVKRFSKRPRALGTVWGTKKFFHGPRIRSPKAFKSLYIVKRPWLKRRGLKIPRGVPKKSRVKIGVLKRTGKLAVQSYITPRKGFSATGPYVRKGYRIRGYVRRLD